MMYAVVMGGGKGTRFWPKSTQSKPKQFLRIAGDSSMLQQTVARLKPVIPSKNILFIGNKSHLKLAHKDLKSLPLKNIISEPVGRNTAPCLGLASILLYSRDKNATVVALPADHVISNVKKFQTIIKRSLSLASKTDAIITIGIKPNHPHTGYGYIEHGKVYKNSKQFFHVKRFVEKPSHAKARMYLKKGTFYWNSGIFVFRAALMLKLFQEHQPVLYRHLIKVGNSIGTRAEKSVINREFPKMQSISIDYAIMEKVSNILMTGGDFGWNDVGTWASLDEILKKDSKGNVRSGDVMLINSSNNVVDASDRTVTLLDVDDLIVVQTDKNILVTKKSSAQRIRNVVDVLKNKNRRSLL